MNPCPQCGAIPQPSDKFCNICGTPVVAGPPGFGAPPPQQGGFGAPPPQQGGFGAPPPNQYGAPAGAPPFGNDQYGQYGQQPAPGFGAPPPQPGFGQPAPYGQPGFGAPPPQPGFDPNYGQQPPPFDPNAQFGYGQQPAPPPFDPNAQYGGYGQQPAGYGQGQQPGFPGGQYAPPPPPQGFGAPPPPPPGFPPPQQQGFPPPQAGGFGGSVAPPGAEAAPAPPPAIPANLPPNALRGFLVSYQSNTQGDFWALSGGRKTIGRANSGEQVDIPLSDATISSRHAALVVDGSMGSIMIEDTGSTNGTFVNEEHIGFNGKRELRDGDRIRFGGYTTVVKVIGR